MKIENNTEKNSLEILRQNLQKDVNLILSDLEKYIVDSDDDLLKAHFDVDLVLQQDGKMLNSRNSKSHFSINRVSVDDKVKNLEHRTYNADFYSIRPQKRLVKNPFEKVNAVAKTLFSYL